MKRFTNNNKSLIYLIDSNYRFIYLNKLLKEKIPGIKQGDYCYKKLALEDAPCANCPLRSLKTENNSVYVPVFKRWYNVSTAEVDYDDEDCHLILANPITENVNKILANVSDSYDALIEMDLDRDYYRIVSDSEYLNIASSGSYEDLIKDILENRIDDTDYNRFKDFSDVENLRTRLAQDLSVGISDEFRINSKRKIAEYVQFHIIPIDIHNKTASKTFCFIKFMNLSNGKKYKLINKTIINNDPLTGLPRGSGYLLKANELIKDEPAGSHVLIAIDIEHFKMYNEWYGNEAGDKFLVDFAKLLVSFDNEYNSYSGYFGEDNFCIIMPNNKEYIKTLETTLVKYVKSIENGMGYLPAFGVYEISDKTITLLQMYDRACIAVSRVKGNYSNRTCYYKHDMLEQMQEEHIILHKVLNGIKNNEFFFYVQPQCNMITGKIFAAEALVRWRHNGSLIPPGKFIPVLEKTGSIADLDKYLWEHVIAWQRSLLERGIKPVPVSVNVSRMDIYHLDVAAIFIDLIQKYDVNPSYIEIEITESAYIEGFDSIRSTVEKLQATGFKILMDDFGSGYSSLNMLKNVNVDVLKMDMKFLDFGDDKDGKGISILESVVNMIKNMDLPIITEGVETDKQKETLKDMGCRYAQGYLFHKPMPVEQFEEMLKDEENIDYSGITSKKVDQIHVRELLNENLYSDTLINNILGAVAFFSYNGNSVELMRVNEGYYRLFGNECIQHSDYRNQVVNYFYEEDRSVFIEMFKTAYNQSLKGCSRDLRYVMNDTIIWVHAKVFYLNETENKKVYYCSFEDVTEDKLKDLEVEMLNQKLKSTLKIEKIDSWEYDLETKKLIVFSPNKLIANNLSNGNLVIENFPESLVETGSITSDILTSLKKYIKRCKEGKYDDQFVLELPFAINKMPLWLRIKGKPIYENKKVRLLVGSFRNVTKNVLAKDHNNGNKALNILSESAMFSMYVNLTLGVIYSSKGDLEYTETDLIVERDYEVFIKTIINSVVIPEDKAIVFHQVQRFDLIDTYNKNQSLVTIDYRRINKNDIQWRRLSIYMTDDNDNVFGHFFISNIDGFKAQRNQLHIITNTLESLNCGVIRIDKETKEVIAINSAAVALFGYKTEEELINHIKNGYADNVYEDDRYVLNKRQKELQNVGDTHNVEYRIVLPNGEFKYLFGNETVIEDENDRLIIQRTLMDNTEQKKLEQELIHQHAMNEINAIKLSDENKAILMGLNELFVSSYYCNIITNSFSAMKHTSAVTELIQMSNTFDEYMHNYCKKYVYNEDRIIFSNMSSRQYIKKHLNRDNERYIVTYRRIVPNGYKWYKMDIIASSFDFNDNVENIIFAISDIDNEIKEKESFASQIDYYKDLFFSACRDVYLGMILIDLETLVTKSLSFEDNEIKNSSYSGTWDKLCEITLSRVDSSFKDIISAGFSPEKLKESPVGTVNTYKYRINLGKSKNEYFWISTIVRIIEQNGKRMATLYSMDITDEIQALEVVKNNSERDELTGLYNRKRLEDWKHNQYSKLKSCAVLFYDINGLKLANDTLGHKVGDTMIKLASNSIKAILKEGIHAYRYGGDEFLVIIDNPTLDYVKEVVDLWMHKLRLYNDQAELQCKMAVGIAYTDEGDSLDSLITKADQEMYKEKISNRFKFASHPNEIQSHQMSSLLKYIDGEYQSIFEIDLDNDIVSVIHLNENVISVDIPRTGVYSEISEAVIKDLTDPSSLEESLKYTSLDYLKKKLAKTSRIEYEYKPKSKQYKSATVVYQVIEYNNGIPNRLIIANKLNEE